MSQRDQHRNNNGTRRTSEYLNYLKNVDFEKGSGDPYGIRTRVAGVKGQCPRPLDEGVAKKMFEFFTKGQQIKQ